MIGIASFRATLRIWSFSGQTCDKDNDCGLPNSGNCTSQKCVCNTADGYEDSNGDTAKGTCTKSLGRSHKVAV